MASDNQPVAAAFVREMARQGQLAAYYAAADKAMRRWLWSGACEIVWPLVFAKLTRRYEYQRGHHRCASALQRLAPECLDRFHNDVEAVTKHLFDRADQPIGNLDGWLTMCLRRATVDAYRRRRAERGAQQRPRPPIWLRRALGEDPWLIELAAMMLEWVGVEATAGRGLWPLSAWTDRRMMHDGDHDSGEKRTAADVETVLAAMGRRPRWYERNIERALGAKPAPLWVMRYDTDGAEIEPQPLVFADRHDAIDALLVDLATEALTIIRRRIHAGEPPEIVVRQVVLSVFTEIPVAFDLDSGPDVGAVGPEQIETIVDESTRLDAIVAEVLRLLAEEADG